MFMFDLHTWVSFESDYGSLKCRTGSVKGAKTGENNTRLCRTMVS